MMSEQQKNFRRMLEARGMQPRAIGPVTGELLMIYRGGKGPVYVFVNDRGADGYSLYYASLTAKIADDVERIANIDEDFTTEFDAIEAALDYGSAAFEACSTSPDVQWRREDDAKLTAGREALEKLRGRG